MPWLWGARSYGANHRGMNRNQIVSEVKRVAEANGGKPLGERLFYKETGLNIQALQRAGFPNYGHAREAAGYARGTFGAAYSDDELFGPLARLTRDKQHFPTIGEIRVAQYSSGGPSYDAYQRAAKRGPLRKQLLDWCRQQKEFSDVASILEAASDLHSKAGARARGTEKVINGYVYLMRYGASGISGARFVQSASSVATPLRAKPSVTAGARNTTRSFRRHAMHHAAV